MSPLPLVSADYEGFAAAFDSFLGEHRTLLSRERIDSGGGRRAAPKWSRKAMRQIGRLARRATRVLS